MTALPELGLQTGLLARLAANPSAKPFVWLLRWVLPVLLLASIGYRLSRLGWHVIWSARPANPGFYLLLVLQFFLQPLADYLVYRHLWGRANAAPLAVILRKRLLNTFMLDYSGEAFFFLWARRHLKLGSAILLHAIKDSNLLSAGAGLATLCMMALFLLQAGGLQFSAVLRSHSWFYAVAAAVPLFLCTALIFFRRRLTVLSSGQIAATFFIHLARAGLVLAVEFLLWKVSGALPTALACMQFVALRLVITRLPLIPNKDLIFVGVGIAVARLAKVSLAPVATVLVILAAADLILAAGVAGLVWFARDPVI